MLHIVLLILKIIGIIIAAILGILVLLLCIMLFVPVRYEIDGKSNDTLDSLKVRVMITWFLHLVRADVYYKNRAVQWRVRIALKKMAGAKGKEKGRKTETLKKKREEGGGDNNERKREEQELEKAVEEQQKEPEGHPCIPKKLKETKKIAEKAISGDNTNDEECQEDTEQKRTGVDQTIKTLYVKIKNLFQKIKCTFQEFCDKIILLLEKKDKVASFIQDEMHRAAFFKVKNETFKLLRRWKPKKVEAEIIYGFEDPYMTGRVLAGLSILYPFIGECTKIVPDFEHKLLKGRLHVKGHIRACHMAVLAWKLFWCKEVRKAYKNIRSFEL